MTKYRIIGLIVSFIVCPLNSFTPIRCHNARIISPLRSDKGEEVTLYSDDDEDDPSKTLIKKRWNSIKPSIKARMIKEGQERAIMNKKKREPSADKKRRMMMHYKKAMVKKKKDSMVRRPLELKSKERVKLSDLKIGQVYSGTVISLIDFGAYIDISSECDGLLHVSQITRERFVEHPRQVLSPGDVIEVRVTRVNPSLKKMQLTALSENILEEENEDEADFEERIPLDALATDDEMWGEIKRVTSFGAYVELGTVVQGWLHFMDHPRFEYGYKPVDFMKVGDRIRCWISSVDTDLKRIKLTGIRPQDLPGPRREMRKAIFDDK